MVKRLKSTFSKAYSSPTMMSWGGMSARLLQILILTPLIVTRFGEVEIAAWYLFTSLNVFGTVISQRIGLTFTRMFAFAMAGRSNLAPISECEKSTHHSNESTPNWIVLADAYKTISGLNIVQAFINLIIALILGYFGLRNILDGYAGQAEVWIAFCVMQVGVFISSYCQKFSLILRGVNKVALTERWNMIFILVGSVVSCCVLYFGGGMILLAASIQLFAVLGVIRSKWLMHYAIPELSKEAISAASFDRKIFMWALEPTWKGMIAQLGIYGCIQFVLIGYANMAPVAQVASLLFCFRMLALLSEFSFMPIQATQPQISRMLAAQQKSELAKLLTTRFSLSLALYVSTSLIMVVAIPYFIEILQANVKFVPSITWLLLVIFNLAQKFNSFSNGAAAAGNKVLLYWRNILSAVISLSALYCLSKNLTSLHVVFVIYVPLLLLQNVAPYRVMRTVFGRESIGGIVRGYWVMQTILVLTLFIYTYYACVN